MVNTSAAYNIRGIDHTIPSGADVSAGLNCMAALDANGKAVIAAGATTVTIGVFTNAPSAADREAVIGSSGIYACKTGTGTINEGDRLTVDSSGRVIATTNANDWISGIALGTSTAADQYIPVRVGPFGNL